MCVTDISETDITRYIAIDKGIIRCDIDKISTPNVCFVSNLMVDKDNRKGGNATKLIQAAEETAREFGCDTISLAAEYGSWMLDWYKRLGYKIQAVWDSDRHLLLMTKELPLCGK